MWNVTVDGVKISNVSETHVLLIFLPLELVGMTSVPTCSTFVKHKRQWLSSWVTVHQRRTQAKLIGIFKSKVEVWSCLLFAGTDKTKWLAVFQVANCYDVLRSVDERQEKGNKNIVLDLSSDKALYIVLRQVSAAKVVHLILLPTEVATAIPSSNGHQAGESLDPIYQWASGLPHNFRCGGNK